MAIVIKEIHVRATVNRSDNKTELTEEALRKIKKEIIEEVIRIQEKKIEWEREW